MYVLLVLNVGLLALATFGDVPLAYSVAVPIILIILVALRGGLWALRKPGNVNAAAIRRYIRGTIAAATILSLGFGGWGLVLLDAAGPARSTAVALYVFVGSISCCFCLQTLPIAGRIVLIFGALPITLRLLSSDDAYLVGIGLTFVLVAGGVLQALATNHAAFKDALRVRSEMRDLIAALQRSEEHYRHSVDLNPQVPWTSDASGALLELSPRWTALTGGTVNESLEFGWMAWVHPEDLPRVQALWSQALATHRGEDADMKYRLCQSDGTYRWFRTRAWPRLDENGQVLFWYGTLEDIHDQVVAQVALEESEQRYRLASLATNDVIWDVSATSDRVDTSGTAAEVLGYPEALIGTTREWWIERIHPEDRARVLSIFDAMDDPAFVQWTTGLRFRAGDGSYLDIRARGYVARDEDGRPTRLIGALQDITAQKRYENELRRAAHFDSLTQLPNRILFAERLDAALTQARKAGNHVGLVVLDVDRFKTINDSLGHDTGDAILREVAARLLRTAPPSATVARLGGDEFAMILPAIEADGEDIDVVKESLTAVSSTVSSNGRHIDVSLSSGAAVAFMDGDTAETLHKSADLALYAAKRDGPGRFRRFQEDLRDSARLETQMLFEARAALKDERIVPFYQPKICLQTGSIVGFEALLRWHHPARGLLSPAAISAAFDDPGISVHITDRILECVIRDMADWRDKGIEFGRIAINGSPEDFRQGDFAQRILSALHGAQLPASAMELEVTETVFLGQLAAQVGASLNTLSQAGVTIALDDFGTGFASLTHLKQFPVDALKIDRSFVSKLGARETEDAVIVGAVIDLARKLGIRTVAEGIETRAQAAHLLATGCDQAQGFLFGKPMPAMQVAEMVAGWEPAEALALCSEDWRDAVRRVHQERFF